MSRLFYSIDQNSNSLWDPVPKLHGLAAHGWSGHHFVEDIDVAFTRHGTGLEENTPLQLMPERYYRDGTSDWGAGLFYTRFLGRNPLDLRELEPFTGMTTKALARRLELTVDQLYEQFSVSDNWQLVGSSYLFNKHSHRVLGDLRVEEVLDFIKHLLSLAQQDLEQVFIDRAARSRIGNWCKREQANIEQFATAIPQGSLAQLYQHWLASHLGQSRHMRLGLTSQLFAARPGLREAIPLFDYFLTDYAKLARVYNGALDEAKVGLSLLDTKSGELPYFAVWSNQGRMFRTSLALRDQSLVCGDKSWSLRNGHGPALERMFSHGLTALVGKALVMVIEVRNREHGACLALPEQGSLYLPAAHAFQRGLKRIGLAAAETHPVLRVKLNFLEQLKRVRGTQVLAPAYLRERIGEERMELAEFADLLPGLQRQAGQELELAREPSSRAQWSNQLQPEISETLRRHEEARRDLARDPATRAEASAIWDQIKKLNRKKLTGEVNRIITNLHLVRLAYWASRGAILPWSIAAGGHDFYRQVIEESTIEEETEELA